MQVTGSRGKKKKDMRGEMHGCFPASQADYDVHIIPNAPFGKSDHAVKTSTLKFDRC